jgi:NTE family protein
MDNILGGPVDFSQLNVPFVAMGTDLVSGESLALNTGPIAPAIRVSCSVPGIFTPVRRNGRILVDGGVSHNLPTSVVRAMGADYVIAVDLLPSGGATVVSHHFEQEYEPRHIVDVAMHAIYALIRVTQRDLTPADCTITPAIGHISFTDLGQHDQLIARGRAAAEAMLPQLLKDLGRTK